MKKAFERYLAGDIDRKTLDIALQSFEGVKENKEKQNDVAYY